MRVDTEYEILAKEIYQTLLHAQGLTTISVKHNVIVKGKAHEHQIDVYWEYEIAGIKHRFAIECKNYNAKVTMGKVRDFYGVLTDIGNISGVMVTKIGYQKGAMEFGKYYGINLKVLREPTDSDWHGRIKAIHTEMIMVYTKVNSINIAVNEEWVRQNIKQPIKEGFKYNIHGRNDEMWVKDKNGNLIKNLLQLQDELPVYYGDAVQNLLHKYEFKDGYFEFNEFGGVKIDGIQYNYDVKNSTEKFTVDSINLTKAIIQDAITGELNFIHND